MDSQNINKKINHITERILDSYNKINPEPEEDDFNGYEDWDVDKVEEKIEYSEYADNVSGMNLPYQEYKRNKTIKLKKQTTINTPKQNILALKLIPDDDNARSYFDSQVSLKVTTEKPKDKGQQDKNAVNPPPGMDQNKDKYLQRERLKAEKNFTDIEEKKIPFYSTRYYQYNYCEYQKDAELRENDALMNFLDKASKERTGLEVFDPKDTKEQKFRKIYEKLIGMSPDEMTKEEAYIEEQISDEKIEDEIGAFKNETVFLDQDADIINKNFEFMKTLTKDPRDYQNFYTFKMGKLSDLYHNIPALQNSPKENYLGGRLNSISKNLITGRRSMS
ncbi:MAG: hypothetical protein MJ252_16800, partial [archaeon]|nr:hypothetical protein [archaeon]